MKQKGKEILLFILLLAAGLLFFSCDKEPETFECGCEVTEIIDDKVILEATIPGIQCGSLMQPKGLPPHKVGDCASVKY